MTTVLTIAALDLGADKAFNYMARVCNGWAVSGGKTQIQVKTTGALDPSAGDNPNGAIATAARNLNDLIFKVVGPKIVFGYSQGAQIAGEWLRRHGKTCPIQPSELSFLLIGNPERRFGKQPWTKKITPDDTPYGVRDVARRHDNWADYDPAVHPRNKIAAMFGKIHTNYWKTDPFGPDAQIVQRVGKTEYVIVP